MENKEESFRYFIDLCFYGTHYHGWQVQPNAASVQQTLEKAASVLLKEQITMTGTGRTDTQVHARHFTAHFDTLHNPGVIKELNLVYKLNSILPADIAIQQIRQVKPQAHARFSATSRSYEYIISRKKDPFMVNRAWRMERKMNFNLLEEATNILLEYNNFKSFTKSNTQVNNYICNLESASWQKKDHLWIFTIRSNRFLRNMIRAITGTLTEVALGKISLMQMREIIESKNRNKAGYSVPGYGLYFLGATFDDEIFLSSPL